MNLDGLTVDGLHRSFEEQGYICEKNLAVTVFLALKLNKPLLVEGAPGVGKTEIAKVLSRVFDAELIRLQCYEGLDENKALYEWNYQKQLLRIQMQKENIGYEIKERDLFSDEYLLERPLLKAIRSEKPVVLLIDEVDKVEDEFEAFLFEVLSDFQVSIPELGTIAARQIPIVVLTSNRERELSDGLKRRCVYLFIDYPTIEKEVRILKVKAPEAGERLSREVARAVNLIRSNKAVGKKPAISESIDWARALVALGAGSLSREAVMQTLNIVLKNKDDIDTVVREVGAEALAAYAQKHEN
ncbi:MoxR-like ATPase [Pelotomaculum thermopropionicum SI]|uniref:MoxR-like ATPase n=1 Tax=Pelotomaculum thermopropionicum (strain DSM 13744 / JCM 10971 / SI) TaxID=370438 RepID=A5D4U1_PELTS|nr:MoxR-like ATPase [Pelotomaculum thermopropionicum SI]